MDTIELSSEESNQEAAKDPEPAVVPVFDFFGELKKITNNVNIVLSDDEEENIRPSTSTDTFSTYNIPNKSNFNIGDAPKKPETFTSHPSLLSTKSSSGVYSLTDTDDDDFPITFDEPKTSVKAKTKSPSPKKRKVTQSKADKEREKALKKAMAEESKSLRPGECIKHMCVEIGPAILNRPYSKKILEVIHSHGIQHISAPPDVSENCFGWKRKMPRCLANDDDGKLQLSSEMLHEPFLLLLVDMQEFEQFLVSKTLNSQIKFLKESSMCQVTLLLYGSKAHLKSQANKRNRNFKNKVQGNASKNNDKDSSSVVYENDVEYYLTKLLFEESVSCVKADNPDELAVLIYQFTKSIAEIPYNKAKEEVDKEADFYMRGENKKCVVVDKQGNGLLNLWIQSLTKFPLASLETSQAICEHFPSPASLIEFFGKKSKEESIKFLSEIGIRRSKGPLATARKLGPELAKKIYTFYTSTDGSELLT